MENKTTNEQIEHDVENALRARGLKEQMQQWDEEERRRQTIVPLWPKVRKVLYPVAVAAMFCGILWTAIPASTWNSGYKWAERQLAHFFRRPTKPEQPIIYTNSNEVILALAQPSIAEISQRNGETQPMGHEEQLSEAAHEVMLGHYTVAQQILDEIIKRTEDDSPRYTEIMDDANYLTALCQLGLGQRTKAKRALKAIAKSNNSHKEQAEELLQHFQ